MGEEGGRRNIVLCTNAIYQSLCQDLLGLAQTDALQHEVDDEPHNAVHGQRHQVPGDAVTEAPDVDAPDDDGDSGASAAVAAAIHMQRALRTFNATREAEGEAPIAIGVGLHTGSLMLGTLGGQDRLNASVIGDAVNLAARIEGLTKRWRGASPCPFS